MKNYRYYLAKGRSGKKYTLRLAWRRFLPNGYVIETGYCKTLYADLKKSLSTAKSFQIEHGTLSPIDETLADAITYLNGLGD